ncbi:MAG: type III secretion HpaP family protein [Pseudomonadota bacterium]
MPEPVEPTTPVEPAPAELEVTERFERALEQDRDKEQRHDNKALDGRAADSEEHHLPVPARRRTTPERPDETRERRTASELPDPSRRSAKEQNELATPTRGGSRAPQREQMKTGLKERGGDAHNDPSMDEPDTDPGQRPRSSAEEQAHAGRHAVANQGPDRNRETAESASQASAGHLSQERALAERSAPERATSKTRNDVTPGGEQRKVIGAKRSGDDVGLEHELQRGYAEHDEPAQTRPYAESKGREGPRHQQGRGASTSASESHSPGTPPEQASGDRDARTADMPKQSKSLPRQTSSDRQQDVPVPAQKPERRTSSIAPGNRLADAGDASPKGSSVLPAMDPTGGAVSQIANPGVRAPAKHAADDPLDIDIDADEPPMVPKTSAETLADAGAPQKLGETAHDLSTKATSHASAVDRAEEVANLVNKLALRIQRSIPAAGADEVRIVLDHDTLQGTSITINRTAEGISVTFDTPNQDVRDDIDFMKEKLSERLVSLTGLPAKIEVMQAQTRPATAAPLDGRIAEPAQSPNQQDGQQGDGRSRNRRDPYEETAQDD